MIDHLITMSPFIDDSHEAPNICTSGFHAAPHTPSTPVNTTRTPVIQLLYTFVLLNTAVNFRDRTTYSEVDFDGIIYSDTAPQLLHWDVTTQ